LIFTKPKDDILTVLTFVSSAIFLKQLIKDLSATFGIFILEFAISEYSFFSQEANY
jgi:hypothetical protein